MTEVVDAENDMFCYLCKYSQDSDNYGKFECHRFPPIYDSYERGYKFPYVLSLDWCGEWKMKEEK